MFEDHEKQMKDDTKKYLKNTFIGGLIFMLILFAMIIISSVCKLSDGVFNFLFAILGIAFLVYIIVNAVSFGKKSRAANKAMIEKCNSGEITKQEYMEFVKKDAKGKNLLYIVIIIVVIIRIISSIFS